MTENIKEIPERGNPPALTLKPRQGTLSIAELKRFGAGFSGKLSEKKRIVATGVLLLWHDHWPEAHAAAHENEGNPDSDFLHSLVHRREGDYGNALYWLREAGDFSFFETLGPRVAPLLEGEEGLARKILPGGKWDPRGFVAAIKARPDHAALSEIQAEELLCFYESLFP